jgi:glycosyltransferase involved in cell wall biosynthesis
MGRPSVAYAVGGNPEVIEDGVTGILIEPRDEQGFADALELILRDPEKQVSQGRAGRRRFLDVFTHDQMVSRYVALYEALLPVRAG